jgi:ribosomal protein L40E
LSRAGKSAQIANLESQMTPEVCPNCGAEVPRNAKSCPGCGSDEKTGWSETAYASGLGLPDEEFDYDEFVKEEFGGGQAKPRGIHWLWWLTALLLVLAFLFFFFR